MKVSAATPTVLWLFLRVVAAGGRHDTDPLSDNVFSRPVDPYPTMSPSLTRRPTTSPSPTITARPTVTPNPTQSPTASPAPTITARPTMTRQPTSSTSPSTSPSFSPAPTITARPTTTPLPSTTPSTSPRPSVSPRPTVSTAPSISPSVSPQPTISVQPTITARPTITAQPTITARPTITAQPTAPKCQIDVESGFFGTIGNTTTSAVVISFGYQVEAASDDIEAEVLPPLEIAFANALLPEFFGLNCSALDQQQISTIAGVSTQPQDIIFTDVGCEAQENATNQCVVVAGEMLIFVNGATGDEEDRARTILRERIENGDFNDEHPSIVQVSYVDLDAQTVPGIGLPTSTPAVESRAGGRRNDALLYGLVGGAALLLIGVGAYVWRRQRTSQAEGIGDQSTATPLFRNPV